MKKVQSIFEFKNDKKTNSMRDDIVSEIICTPMEGVRMLNEKTAVVSMADLKKFACYTPDYYSAFSQGDIVEKALKRAKTTQELRGRIAQMLRQKGVRNESGFCRFNPTTLRILENSLN